MIDNLTWIAFDIATRVRYVVHYVEKAMTRS